MRRALPVLMVCLCVPAVRAELDVPRYAHSATALTDGRVLVVGGLGPGDGFVLGSELGPPEALAPGPRNHRARAFHTATRLLDGTVLIAGGFILPYSTSRTAEVFDGERFVFLWSRMSAPRELHSATLLEDGRVLIAGGFVGGVTSLTSCDLYAPATHAFAPTGSLAGSRFGHAACRLADGRVLVSGGSQFPDERTLRDAEVFDPATEHWAAAAPMHEERSRHTMTLLADGRVLVTGGNSIGAGRQLASTEIYDPAANRWQPGPEMSEPRMDHTATLLGDGRVLIAGGFNGVGEPHTVGSCAVYDPANGNILAAGRLPQPVHEHAATALSDGRVLLSGGMIVAGGRRSVTSETIILTP